jgi:valyl-tRNA synthetase
MLKSQFLFRLYNGQVKTLMKLNKDIDFIEGKLNNPTFTGKAPPDIIQKEQEKLSQAQLTKDKLLQHQATIISLGSHPK